MTFDLEVHFEYLCAFVPNRPFVGPSPPPDQCSVVLPNLRNETGIFRHVPVVVVDEERVEDLPAGQARRGFDATYPDPENSSIRHCDLQGEWVQIVPSFDAAHQAGVLEPQTALNASADPSASQNLAPGDLYYLFRLARSGLAGMDMASAAMLSAPDPARVAAIVDFAEGSLSADAVTDLPLILYQEGISNELHRQKIARRIVLKIDGLEAVDLKFRKFDAAADEVSTLRLVGSETEPVTLRIRNCEEDMVFDLGEPGYDQSSSSEINLYFRLADGYDGTNPPPRQTLQWPADGPAGVCAPKVFDGKA